MDHKWLNLGPTWLFLGLMSAEGHLKLALAVPGSPWAGPYDPMGALYGRRGHGRLRRPRIHIPGSGKGLTLVCGTSKLWMRGLVGAIHARVGSHGP